MENDDIALIILYILVGVGGIWVLIGSIFLFYEKRRKKICMSMTYGQIITYSFLRQMPEPVIEYKVSGIKYRKSKAFKAIITRANELSLEDLKPEDYDTFIDDKDIVHIIKGPSFNILRAMKELYPIGASIKVFYNPKKPRESYIETIPKENSIFGVIFIYIGLGVIIIGIIVSTFFI